jgi:hypothetical protein
VQGETKESSSCLGAVLRRLGLERAEELEEGCGLKGKSLAKLARHGQLLKVQHSRMCEPFPTVMRSLWLALLERAGAGRSNEAVWWVIDARGRGPVPSRPGG